MQISIETKGLVPMHPRAWFCTFGQATNHPGFAVRLLPQFITPWFCLVVSL